MFWIFKIEKVVYRKSSFKGFSEQKSSLTFWGGGGGVHFLMFHHINFFFFLS